MNRTHMELMEHMEHNEHMGHAYKFSEEKDEETWVYWNLQKQLELEVNDFSWTRDYYWNILFCYSSVPLFSLFLVCFVERKCLLPIWQEQHELFTVHLYLYIYIRYLYRQLSISSSQRKQSKPVHKADYPGKDVSELSVNSCYRYEVVLDKLFYLFSDR